MKSTMISFIVALLVGSASSTDANPINKVIGMLGKMQSDIIAEGKEAQTMYAEFAEMCEDRSRELHNEIKTSKAKVAELTATIEKAVADEAVLEEKISDAAASTSDSEDELKKATKMRKKEAADFAAESGELQKTIGTIERAITIIEKEGASASLAQLSSAKSITQVLATMAEAEAINSDDAQRLTSLVQSSEASSESTDEEEVSGETEKSAESQSSQIVDTLEALLDKTQKQLEDARSQESNSKNAYEMLAMSLKNKIKTVTKEMGEAKKTKASTAEKKATAEGNLEVTKKDLGEDGKELGELHHECLNKATSFEEDMSSHNEELKALAEAKKILLETTGGASKQSYDLAQTSFVQAKMKSKSAGSGALHVVRSMGLKYHSEALIELANRIEKTVRFSGKTGASPFGKVKSMVESMILKLEKEAEEGAKKKEYCDKEMGETQASKEDKEFSVEKIKTQIDVLSAETKTLKAEVARLEKELAALSRTQAEMDKLRAEEKSIYAKNKPVMEQGLEGVKKALAVMRDYFAQDSFLQEGGSAGGAAGGIIGMLEVVESDFSKSIAEMVSSEQSSQAEYDASTNENNIAKATKEQDAKYKTAEFVGYEKTIAEVSSDKAGIKSELEAVLEYFASLKKDCIAAPDSYEDKKKRRDDEISGLREALNTLGGDESLLQTITVHSSLRGSAQSQADMEDSSD